MSTVTIDRHVLASNTSHINLAWRSFGWTPGIAGGRATRLEEEVPWGTLADRAAAPGWLAGTAAAIAEPENLDRLQWAFLPLDGRLGLSMWGAGGDRSAAPGDRRVLTHTLLFDEAAFRHLAGYPFGLLGTPSHPAGWLRRFSRPDAFGEPAPLEAIQLEIGPSLTRAFETARLAEVRRLRSVILERLAGDPRALAVRIGRIFEALASSHADRRTGRVALRDDVAAAALLVRLVWLSLPLADRVRTWFSTEQARTERPRAHLMVLPTMEWGRAVPPGTVVLDSHAGGGAAAPSRGRARWAALAVGPRQGRLSVEVLRRADVRGWSVLDGDASGVLSAVQVARLLERWRREGPSLAVAEALSREEMARARPRLRAAGGLLAHAARTGGKGPQEAAERLIASTRAVGLPAAEALDGAVRTLVRSGPDGAATGGFARCFACLGPARPELRTRLGRLGDAEAGALKGLLEDPEGLPALVLAAEAIVREGGGLATQPGGSEVMRALGRPEHVARVLSAGTRIPAEPYLRVAGVSVAAVAQGIDLVGRAGLEPESVDSLVTHLVRNEAAEELVRIWRHTEGRRLARLQLLSHPGWRRTPEAARIVYEAAGKLLAGEEDGGTADPDLVAELEDGLLPAWLAVALEEAYLGDPESLLIADVLRRWASGAREPAVLGGAVSVGQRTGGVALGSPAVSPNRLPRSLVLALSPTGLEALLVGPNGETPLAPPSRPGMLAAVLESPRVLRLRSPQAMDVLLRLLWDEWTPEQGVPSLRAGVLAHGGAIAPLIDCLLEAGPPIPLGSLLRALYAGSASPGGQGRPPPRGQRTLFLRAGSGP